MDTYRGRLVFVGKAVEIGAAFVPLHVTRTLHETAEAIGGREGTDRQEVVSTRQQTWKHVCTYIKSLGERYSGGGNVGGGGWVHHPRLAITGIRWATESATLNGVLKPNQFKKAVF